MGAVQVTHTPQPGAPHIQLVLSQPLTSFLQLWPQPGQLDKLWLSPEQLGVYKHVCLLIQQTFISANFMLDLVLCAGKRR